MRYHSDPDHGLYWALDTAVVSLGEPRRFNFRRITDDGRPLGADGGGGAGGGGSDETDDLHQFHVFEGDVVHMFDDCQDRFQHCVMKSEQPPPAAARAAAAAAGRRERRR